MVTRQRPGSANGVIFITLEDETGNANLIVWPKTFERFRRVVLQSTMIGVEGPVQRDGIVVHVLAERLVTLDRLLGRLSSLRKRHFTSVARFPLHNLLPKQGLKTHPPPPPGAGGRPSVPLGSGVEGSAARSPAAGWSWYAGDVRRHRS